MRKATKTKKRTRREWTAADLRALKAHSKQRTPVPKISKQLKRTIGALRVRQVRLASVWVTDANAFVAFNTAAGWSCDISEEIADDIAERW